MVRRGSFGSRYMTGRHIITKRMYEVNYMQWICYTRREEQKRCIPDAPVVASITPALSVAESATLVSCIAKNEALPGAAVNLLRGERDRPDKQSRSWAQRDSSNRSESQDASGLLDLAGRGTLSFSVLGLVILCSVQAMMVPDCQFQHGRSLKNREKLDWWSQSASKSTMSLIDQY